MTDFDALHFFPRPLPRPKSNWAVFIDRDGVLWDEIPVGNNWQEFTLYPGVTQALNKLNKYNILTVVINNQARVARGQSSEKEAQLSNQWLDRQFQREGAKVDLIIYCPHSPKADDPKYRVDCPWRKPGVGMLEFVHRELKTDLTKSIVIGDQSRDFLAARRVGAKSIGVKSGKAGEDKVYQAEPDLWAADFPAAVNIILKEKINFPK